MPLLRSAISKRTKAPAPAPTTARQRLSLGESEFYVDGGEIHIGSSAYSKDSYTDNDEGILHDFAAANGRWIIDYSNPGVRITARAADASFENQNHGRIRDSCFVLNDIGIWDAKRFPAADPNDKRRTPYSFQRKILNALGDGQKSLYRVVTMSTWGFAVRVLSDGECPYELTIDRTTGNIIAVTIDLLNFQEEPSDDEGDDDNGEEDIAISIVADRRRREIFQSMDDRDRSTPAVIFEIDGFPTNYADKLREYVVAGMFSLGVARAFVLMAYKDGNMFDVPWDTWTETVEENCSRWQLYKQWANKL